MKSQPHKIIDVTTLGQSYVDLVGEQIGSSLKDMLSFKKLVGGLPAILAMGCARLGLKAAVLSAVGQDPLGSFITETLQQEKVLINGIKIVSTPTTTLALHTQEKNNSTSQFYSDNMLPLASADLDQSIISQSQTLLLAASEFGHEGFYTTAYQALLWAREHQTKVVLILDTALPESIVNVLATILPLCDLIIGHESLLQSITHETATYRALKQLRQITNAILVLNNETGYFVLPQFITEQWQNNICIKNLAGKTSSKLESIAFVAGFLNGWLNKNNFEKSCELGMACLMITQTREENNINLPSDKELFMYLSDQNKIVIDPVKTSLFAHMHYATTRRDSLEKRFTFNFGYHQQWQKMGQAYHAEDKVIQHGKLLIAQGLHNAALNNPLLAIICDDKAEPELLSLPAAYQIARAVEVPAEVPLQFNGDADITRSLIKWPKHHAAKATVIYHPDDRYALRGQQEAALSILHRACRATHHPLIIDITPPANSLLTASTMAHIMHRFYEIGIYPDWWQITAPRDQRTWDSITRTINDNDPYCQGVIVSAQNASLEQMAVMFNACVKQKYCKGFVVSKSIFQQSLDQWFAQRIADHTLVEMVTTHFNKVVNLWVKAQESVEQLESLPQ